MMFVDVSVVYNDTGLWTSLSEKITSF